jgi:N6-adenosine-specific RNA methylase IME4
VLLLGTRGNVPAPALGDQYLSTIVAAQGRHSEKPAAFAEMIERYFPTTPKVEMFACGHRRDGWDHWGNEIVF